MDFDRLTGAYLRHRDEDFWAWEEVHRMVGAGLNEGWKITLLLLEKAASDGDVGCIAAGPLEDLIEMHDHKALDLIEVECKTNSRLQLALSTVAVSFYHEEFERWYSILCKYGLRQALVAETREVTSRIMHLMNRYLRETLGVVGYELQMDDLLSKLNEPLADKRAQRILQGAFRDILALGTRKPLELRPPNTVRESDLRARVKQSLAELESLGYRASE